MITVIAPCILFILVTLWIKPWEKEISSKKLVALLFLDCFAFSSIFSLNFYKIYSFARMPILLREMHKKHLFFGVFFVFGALISGLIFIVLSPEVFINTKNVLDSNIFKLLRNQFTLLTSYLFGFELYRAFKKENNENFFSVLNVIGWIGALSLFIHVIWELDLYSFFSGAEVLQYTGERNRPRGIFFEPRGAALTLGICLVESLIQSKPSKYWVSAVVFILAMTYTMSLSGIIVFSFLLLVLGAYSIVRKDFKILKRMIGAFVILIASLYLVSQQMDLERHVQERSYVVRMNNKNDESYLDRIIGKFETHEAAYLNFLKNDPKFLLLGTGSGMSGIASRKFTLKKDRGLFPNGATSLPLVGAIFLIGQYGLFSFFFLFIIRGFDWSNKNRIVLYLIYIAGGIQLGGTLPILVLASIVFLDEYKKMDTADTANNRPSVSITNE